jgi:hypothetical protein
MSTVHHLPCHMPNYHATAPSLITDHRVQEQPNSLLGRPSTHPQGKCESDIVRARAAFGGSTTLPKDQVQTFLSDPANAVSSRCVRKLMGNY